MQASIPSSAPKEAPAEGRRDRKRRELRERVYEVARDLFRVHGFEATTVEQIAEAADIAPATFFNYFQSKSAVLGMMTSEVVTYVGALADQHLRGDVRIGEQLVGLAADAGAQIAENRGIARDVVLDLMRTNARPDDQTPYLGRVREPVAAMIERGQASGEIRCDEDADFLAEMVVGALNATVTHWLSDPDYPIAERLPRAAQFVWEAIRASDN
jgi:AcrR family transcriptional regulator